jgi:arylsulfatase A-like enzyme
MVTNMPCNTSDIFPTLLDIAGVKLNNTHPLDGMSLTPLITGRIKNRPKPMGFWSYPEKGISTPSDKWMAQLLQTQKQGNEITDPVRLCLDAGTIKKQYPKDSFPGHAAWLDWPWKLHRIENDNGNIIWELYDLANDPNEKNNVLVQNAKKADSLKAQLENWQRSVIDSLNGKDYR